MHRLGRAGGLALLPAAAAVLLWMRPDLPGMRMFALLACAYGAVGAVVVVLSWRSPAEVDAVTHAVARLEHDLWKQRMALQTQIEVLCAEREIGLILRGDVDFKTILEKCLGVIAGLFGADCSIEVQVGGQMRAVWAEGRALFDKGLTKHVRPCGLDVLEVRATLAYDGEAMGSVRIRARLGGDARDRVERGRLLEAHTAEIAGFLALALKTPDLYTRAVEDALTGLATKRHFLHQLEVLGEQARREAAPLSLIMIDIDHFKKINDRYGHMVGDRVLKGVAEVVRRGIRTRAGDAAYSGYRYGGEEMSVLLPRVTVERAAQIAERIRAALEAKTISGVNVTASLGVAQYDPASMPSLDEFVARADAALYRAKESGRNRVIAAEGHRSQVTSHRSARPATLEV